MSETGRKTLNKELYMSFNFNQDEFNKQMKKEISNRKGIAFGEKLYEQYKPFFPSAVESLLEAIETANGGKVEPIVQFEISHEIDETDPSAISYKLIITAKKGEIE